MYGTLNRRSRKGRWAQREGASSSTAMYCTHTHAHTRNT
jgi:hypothetical protein